EYLCSEAMEGLKIPTTRVLAILIGDDKVQREEIELSAVVARVFPTNIRFGHFEMCFHFEKKETLKKLIEYTCDTFFDVATTEEMLTQVVSRTAKLMAHWQNVGFCHGVMNTDNMSILGLTIDYGPFGFLEDTILNYVCNHSDHRGRYAYNQQPSVAMWNLERLLICFMDVVPKEKLEAILNTYVNIFEVEYARLCREKLGLKVEVPQDFPLFIDLLKDMGTLNLDYTFFFRQLASYEKGKADSIKPFWDYYGQRAEIIAWLKRYDERLGLEALTDAERNKNMKGTNPKFVLKNYIAQEVIQDVEAGSDKKLKQWLDILYRPFDEHPEFESFAGPTPLQFKNIEVSCSS
nr:YdiU family protein [Bdellovibrionales bacterium]